MTTVTVLGSGEEVDLDALEPVDVAGARLHRDASRLLAPTFRGRAVDLGDLAVPDPSDEDALAALVLAYVEQVRAHDWSDLRGMPLEDDRDWLDLRGVMVRVGWGPPAAREAWSACRDRPYSRDLPTAAGWAAAGWVVPAGAGEPDPAFASPVLETRGLLRWAYLERWRAPVALPDGPPPPHAEAGGEWGAVQSRLRQDHYTGEAREEAIDLALAVLERVGLGPRTPLEAEDEPLPDRDVEAVLAHDSGVVRAAGWFLLRDEADEWLGCAYNECQHHLAVEAEEDAFEQEEVLELASMGVPNPVDAAYQRRRLLTLAFGDVSDVPLAGAGDVADFVDFYRDWVARGKPEEEFQEAVEALRDRTDPEGGAASEATDEDQGSDEDGDPGTNGGPRS